MEGIESDIEDASPPLARWSTRAGTPPTHALILRLLYEESYSLSLIVSRNLLPFRQSYLLTVTGVRASLCLSTQGPVFRPHEFDIKQGTSSTFRRLLNNDGMFFVPDLHTNTSFAHLDGQDIIGLVASCGQILEGIINVIERSTNALDRARNGVKYLNGVCTQVKITMQILENIVKVENQLHGEHVSAAVSLVKLKATDLKQAVTELSKSQGDGGFKMFLKEFFLGDAKAQKFDRLQSELSQAQTTLITSLVAVRIDAKNIYYINLNIVNRVSQCFGQCEDVNCARRIIHLLRDLGEPVSDDQVWWQVQQEDLEKILEQPLSSERTTIRVMRNNELRDFSLATADVGDPGEEAPHVDKVVAERNKLFDDAYMVAGPVSYETSTKLQTMRASLYVLKRDEKAARKVLESMTGLPM